jgi:hypothetical protein
LIRFGLFGFFIAFDLALRHRGLHLSCFAQQAVSTYAV